jgi:hypothetical protein
MPVRCAIFVVIALEGTVDRAGTASVPLSCVDIKQSKSRRFSHVPSKHTRAGKLLLAIKHLRVMRYADKA